MLSYTISTSFEGRGTETMKKAAASAGAGSKGSEAAWTEIDEKFVDTWFLYMKPSLQVTLNLKVR